jgi:hypothetical protein
MLKTNEYGQTYLFHLDQHQLANVTILSRRHVLDRIEYAPMWLLFPVFRVVRHKDEFVMTRPIVRASFVGEEYVKARLAMQIATCR